MGYNALVDDAHLSPVEIEEAVIASCIIDASVVPEVVNIIWSSDFSHRRCRVVYEAILRLHYRGDPIDQITVWVDMRDHGTVTDDNACMAYLSRVISILPTSVHGPYYATLVHDYAQRRKQVQEGCKLVKDAYKGSSHNRKRFDGVEL